VRILLENSAGGKGSIGTKFEKIADILDNINEPGRTGVCLDTCHAVAAGYELRSDRSIESLIDTIDSTIGLGNLHLIHANDSIGGIGEGKDRHGHIGLGNIGSDGFRALGKARRIGSVPFILETPIDKTRGDFENVAVMKKILGI
jgi:deoxyribonuclease-4